MAEELKPYPAYKDSGVPWLGEVPAHWEIRAREVAVRNAWSVLSETATRMLTLLSNDGRDASQADRRTLTAFKPSRFKDWLQVCWPAAILSSRHGCFAGAVGVSDSMSHRVIALAYIRLPTASHGANARFYAWFLFADATVSGSSRWQRDPRASRIFD